MYIEDWTITVIIIYSESSKLLDTNSKLFDITPRKCSQNKKAEKPDKNSVEFERTEYSVSRKQ